MSPSPEQVVELVQYAYYAGHTFFIAIKLVLITSNLSHLAGPMCRCSASTMPSLRRPRRRAYPMSDQKLRLLALYTLTIYTISYLYNCGIVERQIYKRIVLQLCTCPYKKIEIKSLQFIDFHANNSPYLAKPIFRHDRVKYHPHLLCVRELLIQKGV